MEYLKSPEDMNVHPDQMINAFEEVAADFRTFDFMDGDQAFVDQVFKKYDMTQDYVEMPMQIFSEFNRFVDDAKEPNDFIQLATKVATFSVVDSIAYDTYMTTINEGREKLGEKNYQLIVNLVDTFIKAKQNDISGIRDSLELIGGSG